MCLKKVVKCVNCGEEAKWDSDVFKAPLCSKCAREEVNKLIANGNYPADKNAVNDFYNRIINLDANQTKISLNPETGLTKIN